MVVPISAATEAKVGALEKFLKPQVGFLWLLSVSLRFGEVRDWLQQPDMPWLSTACGLYTPSPSVCSQVGSCLAHTSHFLRGFLKPPCFLINTHLFLSTNEPLRLGFICPEYVWEYLIGCGHLHDWGFVMEYRACHPQGLNQESN